jgi:hypothetical protein
MLYLQMLYNEDPLKSRTTLITFIYIILMIIYRNTL